MELFFNILWLSRAFFVTLCAQYGGSIGPFAAIDYEPRQARKGAAVIIDSSAGVWLLELPPNM